MNKADTAWGQVVIEWIEMFGEPPPVRTTPQVARKVLRAIAVERAEREARLEPPTGACAGLGGVCQPA